MLCAWGFVSVCINTAVCPLLTNAPEIEAGGHEGGRKVTRANILPRTGLSCVGRAGCHSAESCRARRDGVSFPCVRDAKVADPERPEALPGAHEVARRRYAPEFER